MAPKPWSLVNLLFLWRMHRNWFSKLWGVAVGFRIWWLRALLRNMWATAFFANKAKTGMRHFCLKPYKRRYTPVKRDRFLKSPRNGQHPERDQNEIGTRYEFVSFEPIEGQMSWNTLKTRCSKEGYWGRSKRGHGKWRNSCAIATQ